ncbi:Oidioi.mRNA.OKI2018_I69.PAR.g9932.t1.cds [Oikopleura dioica]|uniref:Oidioi.mRNA.OKI2018_I69.PAR.g9932.t1.cds n=1 Tax=Oikopleura dioica TaxID=34765 RepID=A0ABN7RTB8_OIKDI|nr:Oidioi.mRNA.OKI2018_I69.PAR.g9932.t1.cds [Oikopleura dioica]
MLGTLLDKNPNLIYYFEPLTGFIGPNGDNVTEKSQETQMDLLAMAFECKLPRKTPEMKAEMQISKGCDKSRDENGAKKFYCESSQFLRETVAQYYGSSRFCQKPFCDKEDQFSKKNRAGDCKRLCKDPFKIESNPDALKNQQFFEEKCQNSLGVAIKELRIDTLSRFKRLYEEPEKFGEFKEIQNNPEIRKRTIIIRYEDMSMHPWEKATEIYDFLGLEFDDETRAQFEEATGIHRRRKRRSEKEAQGPVKVVDSHIDIFGVSKTKSSSELLEGWRKISATSWAVLFDIYCWKEVVER